MANGDFEEVLVHEFECGVCKKTFKNENQLQNHLQSKKHKDAYNKLKKEVKLDDETEEQIKE